MDTLLALAGLALAAFVAATPVPMQSEAVLLALIALATAPLWVLVAVASVANVLGSLVTYTCGRLADRPGALARLPVRMRPGPAQMDRARAWWGRWGVWSLLLSWAPLGDVLTLTAGALRTPIWHFIALVTLAKTGRYVVVGWAGSALIG